MSQGVYINTLNTYIGTALYEEFLGENPAESDWAIFSSYFEKEDSTKPAYIKKMMKLKSKPGLFRKYMLEKFDILIFDMHSGRLDDLKMSIKALTKTPLEKEKIVIMISSVLSWAGTEHKMVEDKPIKFNEDGEPIEEEEEKSIDEENMGGDGDDEDNDGNMEKVDADKLVEDDGLTPEERERKKYLEKINLEEDYFNNSVLVDEDGNDIELLDDEENPLEREDEDFIKKLKKIKVDIRIEKLKNVKVEIKVSFKFLLFKH